MTTRDLALPSGRNDRLTFAIGDIHGCFEKLKKLLTACDQLRGRRSARFVLIGDYIDRGSQSRDVVDFLVSRSGKQNPSFICLRGNHEAMLLRAADEQRSDRDLMDWWGNGGEQTLESYGVDDPTEIPREHLDWMDTLPLMEMEDGRLFVHAGIRPDAPIARQSEQDLLWIREPFLSSDHDHGFFVVHGHTPIPWRKPQLRANRLNLDTGACFGGPLTAAVFCSSRTGPLMFLNDLGDISRPTACPD